MLRVPHEMISFVITRNQVNFVAGAFFEKFADFRGPDIRVKTVFAIRTPVLLYRVGAKGHTVPLSRA